MRLEMGVSAPGANGDAPALDPVRGIQLRVDQCKTGPWIEATTAPGTATPPLAGQRLACEGATPGAGATAVPVYEAPALPRGVTKPNVPTPTVMPVPVPGVLNPGERACLRVRASLPFAVPDEDGDNRAPGASLDFTWRASNVGVNLSGTPLGNARGTPVTQTPSAPVPTGTATSTAPINVAPRTSTPTASATVTATASIEYPAFGGMAVEMDGGRDAVAVSWSGTPSLSLRSNWSFDLWLRPSSVTGARTICAENDVTGSDVLVIRLDEGRPEVGTRVISREVPWQWIAVSTAPALPVNVWSHLSVSFIALVDHQVEVLSPYADGAWMVTHPDDATGTWVVDDTGGRYAGAAVGGVTWLPRTEGSGVTLSGNAYVSLGTAPSITGTGPFAVHALIRTSFVAGQVIIQQRDALNYNGEYQLHTTGQVNRRWWSYGGGQSGFDAAPQRPLIPITVAIGREIRDNSGQFVGQIQDVRICRRAPSPTEVALLSAWVQSSSATTLRYTDENNHPRPFWREAGGRTWVRVPAIPASGSVTVRQFWGKPALSDGSDGAATFDDFNGTAVDHRPIVHREPCLRHRQRVGWTYVSLVRG